MASLVLVTAGCVEQVERRGHLFTANDLQQVQPGMTQDQVRGVLGTPDTTSTVGANSYYYISSTAKGVSFLQPTEVDRQVLAVYFNPYGTVDHIANYGIRDGKVFDLISRTTPSAGNEKTLLEKLFRGVGKKKQLFEDGAPH
jgi:outer membrane protein assembly factor BamE (lipoprotein component of BamABCDE complex)